MNDDDLTRLRAYIDGIAEMGDQRLPPEPKLSEALGVSRGRLRTLLKRLEAEGLIWRHVGRGTFVGPRETISEGGDWSESISFNDAIDARLILEPQLAAQAALHATPRDLAAMDRCLEEMAAATSFLQWKRLDDKLHRTVAEATHNMLLLMLFDTLRSRVRPSLDARIEDVFGHASGPKSKSNNEHGSFVRAIRAHDAARAEREMRLHLESVRAHLFGSR
jgi:DNA-binding FadR family transcriptional regulator